MRPSSHRAAVRQHSRFASDLTFRVVKHNRPQRRSLDYFGCVALNSSLRACSRWLFAVEPQQLAGIGRENSVLIVRGKTERGHGIDGGLYQLFAADGIKGGVTGKQRVIGTEEGMPASGRGGR